MGLGVINPLGIKHAMDVKNWVASHEIKCLAKFVTVIPAKDGSGFLSKFEFKFATEKEAQMFNEIYKLAEQYGV